MLLDFRTVDQELLWMAGFFDGEGCVRLQIVKRSRYYKADLRVSVSNTDIRGLDPFVKRFGGIRVRSCKPSKSHHKQVYRFDIGGKRAYEFLMQVIPYLLVKREQAELSCRFWELPWRTRRGQVSGEPMNVNRFRTAEQQNIDKGFVDRVKALKRS